MRYRIEVSQTRKGVARVDFPGLVVALEATRQVGPIWLVGVRDADRGGRGSVSVYADSAGDAVWRVARATVRAVAELTGNPIEGEISPEPDDPSGNARPGEAQ
jgi:hypothetical protein